MKDNISLASHLFKHAQDFYCSLGIPCDKECFLLGAYLYTIASLRKKIESPESAANDGVSLYSVPSQCFSLG